MIFSRPDGRGTRSVTHMAKKQETIEKAPPQPLAAHEQGWGFENVRPGDYIIPRIGVCQSNSPERKKGNARYIEGLKEGEMFNSLLKIRYGARIRVIAVHQFYTRIKWHGDIGEGIDCRSFNGLVGIGNPGGECARCKFAQFGTAKDGKGKGTACTDFLNFAVIVLPEKGMPTPEMLAILPFKSTAISEGKQWLSRMRLVSPIIAKGAHEVTVAEKHDEKNDWFIFNVTPAGINNPEHIEFARGLYNMMRQAELAGKPLPVEEPSREELGREPGDDRKAPF